LHKLKAMTPAKKPSPSNAESTARPGGRPSLVCGPYAGAHGWSREKNRVLVEYALGGSSQPISLAEWETELTRVLPSELKGRLASIEEIEAELSGGDVGGGDE